MTTNVTIYHNPRCSKSRQTLSLLEEKGFSPQVIKYLETPPDADTLNGILAMLGLEPRQLMRQNESEYSALNLNSPELSHDELVQAMIDNPRLIERPIVIKNGKAAIGRPPEQVLNIL